MGRKGRVDLRNQPKAEMTPRYAQNTTVSVEKSKAEIERLLLRHGAAQFATGLDVATHTAFVRFKYSNIPFHMTLVLPDPESKEFWETSKYGKRRTRPAALALWEQSCRQRWRALLIYIKGTLEAIELGIIQFDSAFVGFTLLPSGSTVAEWIAPQVGEMVQSGRMPQLITGEQ